MIIGGWIDSSLDAGLPHCSRRSVFVGLKLHRSTCDVCDEVKDSENILPKDISEIEGCSSI